METITHHKFSLFRTQKTINSTLQIASNCFDYLNTFDTLEEAKFAQKQHEEETIILPSY